MKVTWIQGALVGLAFIAIAGFPAVAWQSPRQQPRLPFALGAFRLVDSATVDVLGGTAFGYVDSVGTRIDVFLDPIQPAPQLESARRRLDREGSAFLLSLAQRAKEDGHEGYRVIVDTVRNVETQVGSIPVRIIVFVFGPPEGAFVSFAHLFVLTEHYLKVRLTLPSRVWQGSSAPDFALDLINHLHSLGRASPASLNAMGRADAAAVAPAATPPIHQSPLLGLGSITRFV